MGVLRPILFVHRWLGVLIGIVMTLWCLSGFVMMYSDYPRLSPAEQIAGLAGLRPPPGPAYGRMAIGADTALRSARLEMMGGRAVLRASPALDPGDPAASMAAMAAMPAGFDVASGAPLSATGRGEARAVAGDFAAASGIAGRVASIVPIEVDQWTVQEYRRHQPLYKASFDDTAGTVVYVSGKTGEVVQATTRAERFWAWLGAVPHWLYPTMLRRDGKLWNDVVVYASLIGCFLTATGLYVGISRLKRRRDGRIGSPFAGIWWLHHMAGLFFGVLTLTWVASGLFSMNPWGFLGSEAGFAEQARLAGTMRWGEARAALGRIGTLPPGTVRLEAAPFGGRLRLLATDHTGRTIRLDARGAPAPLSRSELAAALRNGPPVAELALLGDEDAYYYSHKNPVVLPVWRATLRDPARTRLYIDPVSGRLLNAVDGEGRKFRWLQNGLHSLDLPVLRRRPVWDLVVLPLLAGVTLVCATGAWMGIGKVRRDLRRLRRRLGRVRGRLKPPASASP